MWFAPGILVFMIDSWLSVFIQEEPVFGIICIQTACFLQKYVKPAEAGQYRFPL